MELQGRRGAPAASRRRNRSRLVAGIAIWGSVAAGIAVVASARGAELWTPAGRIARYSTHSPERLEVRLECSREADGSWSVIRAGDPVLSHRDRSFVGVVEEVTALPAVSPVATPCVTARIAFDPELVSSDLGGASYSYATASGDMRWIVETLLPPEKREVVRSELARWLHDNAEQIANVARPVAEDVMEHALSVLEKNLAPTLQAHEKEVQEILDKHRESLKTELLPVLKEELGPQIREKAKPILTRIGRELWDQLPMWQFGWAQVRQKMPWQSHDYVDEWWQDFLDNKAIPIVKAHEDELVKAGEALIQQGIKDPKVRAAFANASKELVKDPAFKKLVREIVEESLVRPFDIQVLAKKIFEDPGHRARFLTLEASFRPTLQRIARLLSIDERTNGLSPDLARVLRRIIFKKDQRWVEVTTPGDARVRRFSDPVGPGGGAAAGGAPGGAPPGAHPGGGPPGVAAPSSASGRTGSF